MTISPAGVRHVTTTRAVLVALACVMPAVAACGLGQGTDALTYDRVAVLEGEWWRLWTGHWVHFSPSHAAWNCLVMIAAGTSLERICPGSLSRFVLLTAPALSGVFLIAAPTMAIYGGLSGLATGVVVLLALQQGARSGTGRGWWLAVLGLVAVKLTLDANRSATLFTDFGSRTVQASSLAHVAGAIAAGVSFFTRRVPWRQRNAGNRECVHSISLPEYP